MNAVVAPGHLSGSIAAVASKSMAHRMLILAALADEPCDLEISTTSEDIEATQRCLDALFASATNEKGDDRVLLDCGESGSTLRFLLPVVCALGKPVRFVRHGRLAERPLFPLDVELASHGATIAEDGAALDVSGHIAADRYFMPGDVSSQFISGLLLAASIMDGPSEVWVTTPVQSRPYIELTISALAQFGQSVFCDKVEKEGMQFERFSIDPTGLRAPQKSTVEGDWSNAAFWLAAGGMEAEGLTVHGLNLASSQGDRTILAALAALGVRIARKGDAARATKDTPRAASLDVSAIPDLVPPLAALAATTPGTTALRNAGRLRLKESDRLASVSAAINALGGDARVEGDDLLITGVEELRGGMVDAENDHRIAMMAAIMATHAMQSVTITGAECVAKSYPGFWEDYAVLGGRVTLAHENGG